MTIYTIGHSTRAADAFLRLLELHRVKRLVDVRSFPSSRRHPQFNGANLESSLRAQNVRYIHLPALGGMRKKKLEDSPNQGWQVEGFRNYADHMLTEEFRDGIRRLKEIVAEARTAVMCAEATPYRCHRRLISDFLQAAEGMTVLHIFAEERIEEHRLTPFARTEEGRIVYPARQGSLFDSRRPSP